MTTIRYTGHKGGKSSGSAPTNTPDNLRSADTVELALVIGEGRFQGLVDGGKSFFVGETPLIDPSGAANFQDFEIDFYPGDAEGVAQPLKLSLGGTSNNNAVNVSLRSNAPVIRSGTMMLDAVSGLVPVDVLEVRMVIQRLLVSNNSGTFNHTVKFQLEYKAESAASWTPFFSEPVTKTGKTSNSYPIEFRVNVPRIAENYQIRVTKLTEANDTEHFADLLWESFQEVDKEQRSYPGTAIIRVKAKATDQFSSIPQFSGIYKTLLIRVPSNYDAENCVFTGIWDGTWKFAFSDNPAFVLNDLVSNDRYGMNAYYPVELDPADVYKAAVWCDQRLSDGSRRYTFNAVLQEPRNGSELVKYIAGAFNATFFDDLNGRAYLRVDKDDPAVALFTPENVVDGEFEYSYTDITTRYNDISVAFNNASLDYAEDRRRVFNQDAIDKFGRIPLDFIAVGCTNAPEALRRAHYKLLTALTETEVVNFITNRVGAHLQPFDIILVSDPMMGYGHSGRVKAILGARRVALRDPVPLEVGVSYKVTFQTPTGPTELALIVSPTDTDTQRRYYLTVAADLPANLPEFAAFTISQDGGGLGLPKPYRVTRIEEVDGDPDKIAIEAIEVNRNKFTDADNLTFSDEIDYSYVSPSTTTPPTGLRVVEEIVPYADRPRVNLKLSWDRTANTLVRRYRATYRRSSSDTFRLLHDGPDTEVELEDVSEGTYVFQVVSVGINDVYSRHTEIRHTVAYSYYDTSLPTITGFELTGQGNNAEFSGRDPRFTWRVNYPTNYFELGQEPAGGDTEFRDNLFKEFVVSVVDLRDNSVVYTEAVTAPSFIFTFEKHRAAFSNTTRRRFGVRVAYRNTLNRTGRPAYLEVYNNPPAKPKNLTYSAAVGSVWISFDHPTDPDFVGSLVWKSTSTPVQRTEANLVGSFTGDRFIIPVDPNFPWNLVIAHYDAFGSDDLIPSDEIVVQSLYVVDVQAPAIPGVPTLETSVGEDNTVRLTTRWTENAERDFAYYDVAIKRSDESEDQWQFVRTTGLTYTWTVQARTSYDVKLRAVDTSNNQSGWSVVATLTSTGDSTPPAAVSNFTGDASFRSIWLGWTNPPDADYAHAEVWESTTPQLASAVKIGTVVGTPGQRSVMDRSGLEPGVTRSYWLYPVDTSGNRGVQTGPVTVTTASLQLPDFPADFGPIPTGTTLPASGPQGPVQLFCKLPEIVLYRWHGGAWVLAVDLSQTTGRITSTQVTENAIQTPHLAANSVTATQLAAGSVTAGAIAANSVTAGAIQAGAVTAAHLTTGQLITNRAQIADALIDSAHIREVDASRIRAGTVLSDQVRVGGQTLGQIAQNSGDPATTINTRSTLIEPGKIRVNGSTTLADWRSGSNSTEINGGAIAANTIRANSLHIGARGVTIQGVQFYNYADYRDGDPVMWTGGSIHWVNDSGQYVRTEVGGGSTTDYYVYWVRGEGGLRSCNDISGVMTNPNALHLVSYHKRGFLITYNGGVRIDGNQILAQSIRADQIAANAIQANHIGANQITASHIATGTLDTRHINSGSVLITSENQLGLNVIGAGQIKDLTVTTLKIGENAATYWDFQQTGDVWTWGVDTRVFAPLPTAPVTQVALMHVHCIRGGEEGYGVLKVYYGPSGWEYMAHDEGAVWDTSYYFRMHIPPNQSWRVAYHYRKTVGKSVFHVGEIQSIAFLSRR